MASSPEHSTPERVPLVPPHRAAERGTLAGSTGTEQRNNSGTVGLKALAEQALSRIRGGTRSGTIAEQTPEKPVPPPRNGACAHITEEWLREWYAEHPQLTCARCWLARHPTWKPRGRFFESIAAMKRHFARPSLPDSDAPPNPAEAPP